MEMMIALTLGHSLVHNFHKEEKVLFINHRTYRNENGV
jgi:hypothetical protein